MKRRNKSTKQTPPKTRQKKPPPLLLRLAEFPSGRLALCFAYLLSWTLILVAARGDLWLDEIRSIEFARAAGSPIEIFTRFQHDNNHVLNTLFLWSVGVQSNLFVYWLLVVVLGIVVLVLVGSLDRS